MTAWLNAWLPDTLRGAMLRSALLSSAYVLDEDGNVAPSGVLLDLSR